ncbi:MAG: sugar transferase [Lachnospiraceae bacterium]|nr:sugar transferase [Lachnospiraceae bacterium]
MKQKNKVMEVYGLWLADLLCIWLSFMLSTYLRHGNFRDMEDKGIHFQVCLIFLLFCTVYNFFVDWNRDFVKRSWQKEAGTIVKYNIIMILVVESVLVALKWAEVFSRLVTLYFIISNIIIGFLLHLLIKKILHFHYSNDKEVIKVLVVSQNNNLESTLERLTKELGIHYQITALACLDEDRSGQEVGGIPIVAGMDDLIEVTTSMAFDEVFINTPELSQRKIKGLINGFDEMGVNCHYNLELPDVESNRSKIDTFANYTVITYTRFQSSYKRLLIKRLMDILGGLVGVIITTLFLPFVAMAIKLESRGPVFFSQVRIGRNGRRFKIYKFRSMYQDAEERKKELITHNEISGLMFKMENDPRITKVGRFIRKTSIDELPQFLNVLVGDMSLVGTRPPTLDEFEKYNQYYRRRISRTPGLTGLWQVSGRSEVDDFDDVVKYDLQYIDSWSLRLDIKILLRTLGVVFTAKGSK